jgi:hypothetical protein
MIGKIENQEAEVAKTPQVIKEEHVRKTQTVETVNTTWSLVHEIVCQVLKPGGRRASRWAECVGNW